MKKITDLPERLRELGLHIEVYDAYEIPEKYLNQLIEKSRQPHVLKFEGHEDAEGRFKDKAAFKQWREGKKRIFYLLLHDEDLAGVIWFGNRENPNLPSEYKITFAIRLYEGYVGKGLSKGFMQITHDDIRGYFKNEKIWLDLAEDNIAAEKAYHSFGYKTLKRADGRIVMGLE